MVDFSLHTHETLVGHTIDAPNPQLGLCVGISSQIDGGHREKGNNNKQN